MSSPYEVLGVGRSADKSSIRRAHRRKARETHPDAGGAADDFDRVQKAYRLLIDDGRRARYDETGETDEPTDNAFSDAAQLLVSLLDQICRGVDVRGENLVYLLDEAIQHQVQEGQGYLSTTRREIQTVKEMRARFRHKGSGPDVIDSHLAKRQAEAARRIGQIERRLETIARAAELANSYGYEVEPVDRPVPAPSPLKFVIDIDAMRGAR